ncbi:BREX-2 system adenine-specific DNA-methyltransferase PglX [Streptomyces sp. NBC_01622]|uniref:BREX-2 system adenine-specific DNA-methyltransferase PglX n=1 Tax=Streptomyces sp. NBC_01622 TaxID=2975903 RepID=UPI00386A1FBA|nr:BREX-2 system adenine-specific DNA-methyltransferase PglX [Streptomyces sp. NBC_01622]
MTVTGQDARAGLDQAALLKDLRRQVVVLEDDLRARSESEEEYRVRLESEYRRACEAQRTTRGTYGAWRDERVTQAAVAWVLACVFVRFCEDHGLIEVPFIAGPEERLVEAEERHEAYFREHPDRNDRDWLIAAFEYLAGANETVAGLFDRAHNPLWELMPSYEAATELLRFWRRWDAEGRIVYDFTYLAWDTRFLGDLYQDLSDHARKTYALLQTPEFVEEFILDLTLEPAIAEFGLDPVVEGPGGVERRGLRTIDPACGSGHFLLGIFERLVGKWRVEEPGADVWVVVRRALEAVHGCDKNPFAVSIARFRLLVAAMRAAGAERLVDAPVFPINVAVGDSLLHGRDAAGIQTDLDTLFAELDGGGAGEEGAFVYSTEDVGDFAKRVDLLGRGSYHVVVGNPPYITVKDKQENENYRKAYKESCAGKYALSAPFAQRLFELALKGMGGRQGGGGFVGQITANSFMKREFGKKLVEVVFWEKVELSHVIDTSGAFIPGHGTPTVILVGRNRMPNPERTVRAVLGVRGEPSQPEVAAEAAVWRAIVEQVDRPGPGSEEWVSVEDVPAETFASHPWSVSGGGAGSVFASIEEAGTRKLAAAIYRIGFFGVLGADDAMIAPRRVFDARRVDPSLTSKLVLGDEVRDWNVSAGEGVIFPYNSDHTLRALEDSPGLSAWLWPLRTELGNRATFAKRTYFAEGRPWYEWHQLPRDLGAAAVTIALAFVATHNHFVLDGGGKAFNRSAPVIKFPADVREEELLGLLGVLNSSTACFWLKQVSQDKGNRGGERSTGRYAWESFYEFTGTKLQEFPLPEPMPQDLGRVLDSLAQELGRCDPSTVCELGTPTRARLDETSAQYAYTRRRMIALQEELDWQVYRLYGLLSAEEVARTTVLSPVGTTIPEVDLGERAFEIVIASRANSDEAVEQWFERHGSTPVIDIPEHWPGWYRDIVQARIEIIERRKDIGLIERPECKRRWSVEPWEKKEKAALRAWLLDRCEDSALWFNLRDGVKQPRTLTINQLADALSSDADFNSVAALYASDHLDKPDLPLGQVLVDVIADEHVPYLAAMRYKDSGLRKREQWEEVWEQQREEDRTRQRLDIPVPPKYSSADFLKHSYWSHRGKLDVPKERFISYLEAGPDADPTMLLGWAGWDHKDQAQALINLIEDRTEQGGWDAERLTPLLAGLQEVMPWVRQWHGEYDAEWESVPAEDCDAFLDEQMGKHRLSAADLKAWRPVKRARGRKAAVSKKASAPEQSALDVE